VPLLQVEYDAVLRKKLFKFSEEKASQLVVAAL